MFKIGDRVRFQSCDVTIKHCTECSGHCTKMQGWKQIWYHGTVKFTNNGHDAVHVITERGVVAVSPLRLSLDIIPVEHFIRMKDV